MNDFLETKNAYPNVTFRYYVQPTEKLAGTGLKMIQLDNKTITWPMQLQGRKDGAAAVKAGEGFFFKHMDLWQKSPELKAEFPRVSQYIKHVQTELAS